MRGGILSQLLKMEGRGGEGGGEGDGRGGREGRGREEGASPRHNRRPDAEQQLPPKSAVRGKKNLSPSKCQAELCQNHARLEEDSRVHLLMQPS